MAVFREGAFLPTPYPWVAPKRIILNRVKTFITKRSLHEKLLSSEKTVCFVIDILTLTKLKCFVDYMIKLCNWWGDIMSIAQKIVSKPFVKWRQKNFSSKGKLLMALILLQIDTRLPCYKSFWTFGNVWWSFFIYRY